MADLLDPGVAGIESKEEGALASEGGQEHRHHAIQQLPRGELTVEGLHQLEQERQALVRARGIRRAVLGGLLDGQGGAGAGREEEA